MNPFQSITQWFSVSGRELPWRNSQDPYKIWISEIILQQTRVAQGLDYYLRFVKRFPDVHSLARAELDTVLKNWEGLGYYSRARNLHATAKHISRELNGNFPSTVEGLLKLKGIGPYTARAIASLAFGVDAAVIDGNVFRVLSRYLADASPIDLPATRNKYQAILDSWVKGKNTAHFNQAMMDLGATVCTPRNPNCSQCPLSRKCIAYKEDKALSFPVKAKKAERSTKFFRFHLILKGDKREILVRQRPAKGLWAGLWEVPNEEVSAGQWKKHPAGKKMKFLGEFSHAFTHFEMKAKVYFSKAPASQNGEGLFIAPQKIRIFAFPKAVLKLFERFLPQTESSDGKIRRE